jgi:hypothetical protein
MLLQLLGEPCVGKVLPVYNFPWLVDEFLERRIGLVFPTRYNPPFIWVVKIEPVFGQ